MSKMRHPKKNQKPEYEAHLPYIYININISILQGPCSSFRMTSDWQNFRKKCNIIL